MTSINNFPAWGWLIFSALLSSSINWVAVAKRQKKSEYIFKPLTMVILLLAVWLMKSGQHNTHIRTWFLMALLFSLCGDVFLMFSGDRMFILGLVSFLIAHLCYIVGLNPNPPPTSVWIIGVILTLLYFIVYPRIDRALIQKGDHTLRIPTAVYAIILSLMLGSCWAVLLRQGWSTIAKLSIVLGGSLFYISDLLLAWNRFVIYTHRRDVLIMVTYQIAQIFLTASIALNH